MAEYFYMYIYELFDSVMQNLKHSFSFSFTLFIFKLYTK